MGNIYRSARGDKVDIDLMRIANENTIAIGNMRTNARGDELGPGGKVIKTRSQIMSEYHKLNTPTIDNSKPNVQTSEERAPAKKLATPMISHETKENKKDPNDYVKPRGSFAGSVAEQTEVNQELLQPKNTSEGIKRI